jgi:hypothetical protein
MEVIMDENIKTIIEGLRAWCEWDIGRMGLGTPDEEEAKLAEMVRCLAWTMEQSPNVRKAFFATARLYGDSNR